MKDVILKIVTWNVQSLCEPGKIYGLFQEVNKLRVNIMGLSEKCWFETGILTCCQETNWYHKAIALDNNIKQLVTQFLSVSQTKVTINIFCQPLNINFKLVYAPIYY